MSYRGGGMLPGGTATDRRLMESTRTRGQAKRESSEGGPGSGPRKGGSGTGKQNLYHSYKGLPTDYKDRAKAGEMVKQRFPEYDAKDHADAAKRAYGRASAASAAGDAEGQAKAALAGNAHSAAAKSLGGGR